MSLLVSLLLLLLLILHPPFFNANVSSPPLSSVLYVPGNWNCHFLFPPPDPSLDPGLLSDSKAALTFPCPQPSSRFHSSFFPLLPPLFPSRSAPGWSPFPINVICLPPSTLPTPHHHTLFSSSFTTSVTSVTSVTPSPLLLVTRSGWGTRGPSLLVVPN